MSKPVGLFKKESFGWIQALPTEDNHNLIPLYTHPVKQLSDEKIYKIANQIEKVQPQFGLRLSNDLNVMDFARAIIKEITE